METHCLKRCTNARSSLTLWEKNSCPKSQHARIWLRGVPPVQQATSKYFHWTRFRQQSEVQSNCYKLDKYTPLQWSVPSEELIREAIKLKSFRSKSHQTSEATFFISLEALEVLQMQSNEGHYCFNSSWNLRDVWKPNLVPTDSQQWFLQKKIRSK